MTVLDTALKTKLTDKLHVRNGATTILCSTYTCPDAATTTYFRPDGKTVRACKFHADTVQAALAYAVAVHPILTTVEA